MPAGVTMASKMGRLGMPPGEMLIWMMEPVTAEPAAPPGTGVPENPGARRGRCASPNSELLTPFRLPATLRPWRVASRRPVWSSISTTSALSSMASAMASLFPGSRRANTTEVSGLTISTQPGRTTAQSWTSEGAECATTLGTQQEEPERGHKDDQCADLPNLDQVV